MTRSRQFDALVVGAGPAGAHLAYLLAGQGVAVALLDKQAFPRDKVCGGGLSRKALDLLDFDVAAVTRRTIRGAVLSFGNVLATIKDMDPPAAVTVHRREFDQHLVERAVDRGARFFPDTAFEDLRESVAGIVAVTNRGEFSGRCLFAADGAASPVRKRVFANDLVHYVPAFEALLDAAPDATARLGDRVLFDFDGMARGYGWIFPKGDHLNVGVYSPYGGTALRAQLDAFVARYGMLRGARILACRGAVIPIANRGSLFESGRVRLVGDAAGLADALFGEGIYFALKSATLAARAVAEDGLDRPGRYTALLRADLLPELRAAERMARLVFRFPRFAFRHLVLNETINDDFAGLISGAMGYRRCLRRTLLRLPQCLRPGRAIEAAAGL